MESLWFLKTHHSARPCGESREEWSTAGSRVTAERSRMGENIWGSFEFETLSAGGEGVGVCAASIYNLIRGFKRTNLIPGNPVREN